MALHGNICRYIIAVCFIFIASSSFSQQQIFDRLEKEVAFITGEKRVNAINALSRHFNITRQFDVSEKLSLFAIEEAGKINYEVGEGIAYTTLANTDYFRRNFTYAEKNGKAAIDIFKQQKKDSLLATAYTVWAQSVWAQSWFDEAISVFTTANQLFNSIHDSVNTGVTFSLLALAEEEKR